MYRVHEPPDPIKIHALADFLSGLGYRLTRSQTVRPAQLNQLLHKARGAPEERLVNELVLRSQSQAVYSPENRGHFGLALRRYAHFTSPIRRYADLLVHRALIGGLGLGPEPEATGLGPLADLEAADRFAATGTHISETERRAMAAERDATDRYMAAYLADRVGAEFEGRINGVTRFGLFVTLAESGADGLIPMRRLPDDYYVHDEDTHRLIGRRTSWAYTLGDPVTVRLAEADPLTGSLVLDLLEGGALAPRAKKTGGKRSAPRKTKRGQRRRGKR